MARLLVIMGSGETAPTMVKPHRAIFERVGAGDAVILDTPYGFQTNADDISTKAVGYFAASVGRRVQIASWRSRDISWRRPRTDDRRTPRRAVDIRRSGQPDVRAPAVA